MHAEVLGGSVLMSATDLEINEENKMNCCLQGGTGRGTERYGIKQV